VRFFFGQLVDRSLQFIDRNCAIDHVNSFGISCGNDVASQKEFVSLLLPDQKWHRESHWTRPEANFRLTKLRAVSRGDRSQASASSHAPARHQRSTAAMAALVDAHSDVDRSTFRVNTVGQSSGRSTPAATSSAMFRSRWKTSHRSNQHHHPDVVVGIKLSNRFAQLDPESRRRCGQFVGSVDRTHAGCGLVSSRQPKRGREVFPRACQPLRRRHQPKELFLR
jgi:hypothetical protein